MLINNSIRELSELELESVGGGDLWRFDSQDRVDGDKICNYTNLTTGETFSYNAGSGGSAACEPVVNSFSPNTHGGNTMSSPVPGTTFYSNSAPGAGPFEKFWNWVTIQD